VATVSEFPVSAFAIRAITKTVSMAATPKAAIIPSNHTLPDPRGTYSRASSPTPR
jgi:hypothetical protein